MCVYINTHTYIYSDVNKHMKRYLTPVVIKGM